MLFTIITPTLMPPKSIDTKVFAVNITIGENEKKVDGEYSLSTISIGCSSVSVEEVCYGHLRSAHP